LPIDSSDGGWWRQKIILDISLDYDVMVVAIIHYRERRQEQERSDQIAREAIALVVFIARASQ
jgi:hypothetical protein